MGKVLTINAIHPCFDQGVQMLSIREDDSRGWYSWRFELVERCPQKSELEKPEIGDTVKLEIEGELHEEEYFSFAIKTSEGAVVYFQNSKKDYLTVTKKKEKLYSFGFGQWVKANSDGPVMVVTEDINNVPGEHLIPVYKKGWGVTQAYAKEIFFA